MKSVRQEKILELIEEYEIETQEELAEYLKKAGFHVTQATVSRDIREMKLSKVNLRGGKQKYVSTGATTKEVGEKLNRVMKESYVSSAAATNLIVVHTIPGMAMALAAALDALDLPGLTGCIAGDDTVFCAVATESDVQPLLRKISQIASK